HSKIKLKTFFSILAFFIITIVFSQNEYTRTFKLMGSRFDITVVANNEDEGTDFIDTAVNEISRIEKLISSWDANSQTSEINRNSGIKPVVVDDELFRLIERSIKISKLTNGAFDISYASMDKVWFFDGTMTERPSEEAIRNSVEKVGYQNI